MHKYTMALSALLITAINIYGIGIAAHFHPTSYAIIITSVLTILLLVYIQAFKKNVLLDGLVRQSFIMFGLLILTDLYFFIAGLTLLVYLSQLHNGLSQSTHWLTALMAGVASQQLGQTQSLNLPYYYANAFALMFYLRCFYVMFWKQNIIFIFRYLKSKVNYLKSTLLSQLPRIVYSRQIAVAPCTLCLEEYDQIEDITRLRCNHIFHLDCIRLWVTRSNTCPLCRVKVILY